MKYLYDRASNTLALTFAEGRQYRDSEEVYDGVVLDYDTNGRPYAIEFLRVDEFVDTRGLISGRPVKLSGRELTDLGELTGASLKLWREHLGLTQPDLASHLHLRQELLAAWEDGQTAIENPELLRLALQSVEGNVHEQFLRQALKIVNESLQQYSGDEAVVIAAGSEGRR